MQSRPAENRAADKTSRGRTAILNAALELAAAGWAVFPCIETKGDDEKAPYTTNGFHDASTDPAKITRWWTRWAYAMIGAPVPAECIVLDPDPRKGGTVAALEEANGAT